MIVLVVSDKHDTFVIDATTPRGKDAAILELFRRFKENEFYADLEEPDPWDVDKPEKQKVWYRAALEGDPKAAFRLMEYRKSHCYEYEDRWRFHTVVDPTERKG